MIEVNHGDAILRTFILFVQTARAVLKYADVHLYRKARLSTVKLIVLRTLTDKGRESLSLVMPAAREIVDQVMLSISEGDALQLEKLLKVLRQNAQHGLEHVAGQASPQSD